MLPQRVGQEMQRRRVLLGMTQRDIADAIGRTRSYVSQVEHGVTYDPDADRLVPWAEKLGWPPNYILDRCGRGVSVPGYSGALPPEQLKALKKAIYSAAREAVEAVLRGELGRPEGPVLPPPGRAPGA